MAWVFRLFLFGLIVSSTACGGGGSSGGGQGGVSDENSDSADTIPDPFLFEDKMDIELLEEVLSNSVIVAGIDASTGITIVGGEFSIDDGDFSSNPNTISNGQQVIVRVVSSDQFSMTTDAVLTIGGVSDTFSVTTQDEDIIPTPFYFNSQSGVERNASVDSNEVIISGINSNVPISIVDGEFSIDGGGFSADARTIVNNQRVQVRQTSSNNFNTATEAVLTVGGVIGSFAVTTLQEDITPEVFNIIDINNAPLDSLITSAPIVVAGINSLSPVTISEEGEFSIDGANFTSRNGVIEDGQEIIVRLRSSPSYGNTTSITLSIGGISDSFTVTTVALMPDTVPDAFYFVEQRDVPLSDLRTSNTVTIGGINVPVPISVSGNGGEYSIDGGVFTSSTGLISSGQNVRVRQVSSENNSVTTATLLNIGGVESNFSVTTIGDTTPDQFSFDDAVDVPVNSIRVSNVVTITGINEPALISISGNAGEYSIDGGVFTSSDGVVVSGQNVRVRQISSGSNSMTTTTRLNVGGVVESFSVITEADTIPDQFSFDDEVDVPINSIRESNLITITGISAETSISISGNEAEYRIEGGTYTSVDGTINNGEALQIRQISSGSNSVTLNATINIGGVTDTYSVTTIEDVLPDLFSFENQIDIPLTSLTESNVVTITGISSPASITISGSDAEYSINGRPYTSEDGIINNGENVQLRQTSSSNFSSRVDATLTVGNGSAFFSVTTLDADIEPDVFTFQERNDVPLNTFITSNLVEISGINTAVDVSIENGFYSINDAPFSSDPGIVNQGDMLRLQVLSSDELSSMQTAAITIGGRSGSFSATTRSTYDTIAPQVSIKFPPTDSMTEGDSVMIRGIASDDSPITSIIVNGIEANTTNGYESWLATVPIAPGRNEIIVEAYDNASNSKMDAARVVIEGRDSLLYNPTEISIDTVNQVAYMADTVLKKIFKLDIRANTLSVFYDYSNVVEGSGNLVKDVTDLVVDVERDRLLIVQSGYEDAIFSIDFSTGDQSILSSNDIPDVNPPLFTIPSGMAVDSENGRLLVLDQSRIIAVDLVSGERALLSANARPTEEAPNNFPTQIAVDRIGNRALVSHWSADEIVEIDLNTGAKSIFSIGSMYMEDIAIDEANERLLAVSSSRLYAFDLGGGERSSLNVFGYDGFFKGVDLDSSGGVALITNSGLNEVTAFDLDTEVLSSFWSNNYPSSNVKIEYGESLAYFSSTDEFLIASDWPDVIAVSRTSGERRRVAIHSTSRIIQIVVDENTNQVYFVDSGNASRSPAIFRLAVDTGETTLVSGEGFPDSENLFESPLSMAIDSLSNRLFVLDRPASSPIEQTIYSIDLSDGSRSVFSDSVTPNELNPLSRSYTDGQIYYDARNSKLLYFGWLNALALDALTGERSVLTDYSSIRGPSEFEVFRDIALVGNNDLLNQDLSIYFVDVATGEESSTSGLTESRGFNSIRDSKGLHFDAELDVIYVLDRHMGGIIMVDVVTGERVILSK
ncbi:hypothetical protein NBRC116494_17930 [Aurantivibrio plasticivorans]